MLPNDMGEEKEAGIERLKQEAKEEKHHHDGALRAQAQEDLKEGAADLVPEPLKGKSADRRNRRT